MYEMSDSVLSGLWAKIVSNSEVGVWEAALQRRLQ